MNITKINGMEMKVNVGQFEHVGLNLCSIQVKTIVDLAENLYNLYQCVIFEVRNRIATRKGQPKQHRSCACIIL